MGNEPAAWLTQQHGQLQPSALGPPIGATIHPSAVLRAPDAAAREAMYAQLVDDLRAFRGVTLGA